MGKPNSEQSQSLALERIPVRAGHGHALYFHVVLSGGQGIWELVARLPGRAWIGGLPDVIGALQTASVSEDFDKAAQRHHTPAGPSPCSSSKAQASCAHLL